MIKDMNDLRWLLDRHGTVWVNYDRVTDDAPFTSEERYTIQAEYEAWHYRNGGCADPLN